MRRNGLVLDEDIGVRPAIRGHDFSAPDQQSHLNFLQLHMAQAERSERIPKSHASILILLG